MSEVSPETLQQPSASSGPMDKLVEVISRSQHNYRELIDNLDQAVFTISGDGEIRVANRLFAQILGAPFHELIGHPLSDFVATPSVAELKAMLPVLVRAGSWSGSVSLRLKRESHTREFRCWLQAIVESDTVVSVIGWARDITAQQDRERSFSEFFESLHEGTFVTTPEGEILDANPALIRMFGYDSKEELLTVNFRDLWANPAERDETVRAVGEKGALPDREVMYVRKDGRRIWGLGRGYAVRDASGRMVRLHGMITDVTERREIERCLREERQFAQRLLDCYPDAVLVVNCDGEYIYSNRRIADLTGRDAGEFLGSKVGFNVHPEDAARVKVHFQDFVAGKNVPPHTEYRVRHQDGSWRLFRSIMAPMVEEEGGKITAIISSTRDITEPRLAETQRSEKEKFAAMGHMLAGAAHELNNPLTAILGVADLLKEKAEDETARRRADLILQQARRASATIQGLLAFSRHSQAGAANVSLVGLLTQIVRSRKDGLEKEGSRLQISLELEPDLPPVAGDVKLLAQAFQNILTNAEQSIAAGRGGGAISISVRRAGESVDIAVVDDGPGISPDNLTKIFEPFFTTKRPGGGSGLGLTIALSVIKEHGGDITAEAGPKGSGACIRVVLPVSEAGILPAISASNGNRGLAGKAAPNGLANRSLLVVDDEESIREIACEGLAAKGMTVHGAADAEAALEFLSIHDCDVVLCDFNLGRMKGEELFEELRARRRGGQMPRFVFMTGALVEPEAVARFNEIGARVLQKPFPVSALASMIAEVLQAQTVVR